MTVVLMQVNTIRKFLSKRIEKEAVNFHFKCLLIPAEQKLPDNPFLKKVQLKKECFFYP